MKYHYTAKISFEDNETIETSSNNIEELITWMQSQAETSFCDIKGEIIDNKTKQIVKTIQYSPSE